jgi:hypothetical protein
LFLIFFFTYFIELSKSAKLFKKVKIRVRLIIYISMLLLITMTLISTVIFRRSKEEIQQSLVKELNIINNLKIERVKSYLDNVNKSITQIEYNTDLDSSFKEVIFLHDQDPNKVARAKNAQIKLEKVFSSFEKTYGFHRIMLKSLEGYPLIDSRKINSMLINDSILYKTNAHIFTDAQKSIQYSDIYHPTGREDEFFMTVLAPYFKDKNEKEPIAIVCCEIPMEAIYQTVEDTTGLGATGCTILTKRILNKMHFISRPRDFIGDFLKLEFDYNKNSQDLIAEQMSLLNKNNKQGHVFEMYDRNQNKVDVAWGYIGSVDWGIVTKIDHKESFTAIQYLRAIILMLCAGIIFFAVIIITIFVEKFLTPIINIRDNLVALAKGNFPKHLDYDMTDEINDTTIALNNLVDRLKNSTDFAKEIGEGNLNAEFYGKQTQDVLTTSLLRMQESLKAIDEENNRRKWATEGFAIHGELFRKSNSNINVLGESFIRSLVPYIKGVHGAVYAINHIGSKSGLVSLNQDDTYFELIGNYAYDLKEDTPRKFRVGQSLVGQCAKEKKTIVVNDENLNLNYISSGLGKSKASHLICVPMILNQQVMGVVELSSFGAFETHIIQFIEMLGESFASAVMNVQSNYQTLHTLKEFEHTTTHLMFEQEELKSRYESALTEIKALKLKISKLEKNPES